MNKRADSPKLGFLENQFDNRDVRSKIAELVSRALNAPMIASFTFLVLMLAQRASGFLTVLTIAVTFGAVIPLSIRYLLSKHKPIPNIYASSGEGRTIAFMAAILSYLLGAIALRLAQAPSVVTALMICYLGNSLIMMLVSLKWKISVHASGITGPTTVLVYSLGPAASLLSMLLIPVGWARIKLGAHSLAQVSAGALLTIATTWLQLRLLL